MVNPAPHTKFRTLPRPLTKTSNLPGPDQSWRIQADEPMISMAWQAENQNGPVLLSPARRKRDLGAAATRGDRM